MDENPTTQTSRRALLAAAGGAAAALAVESLVRPLPAAATDDSALMVGRLNTATKETSLELQNPGVGVQNAFRVRSVGVPNGHGCAISARGTGQTTGISGLSEDYNGVEGASYTGCGVMAHSVSGTALFADNKVLFNTAGKGTVPKGEDRVVVHAFVEWSPSTLNGWTKILVTLMSDPGSVAVKYVQVDPPASEESGETPYATSFTVYLTAKAKDDLRFAYFVIS
jgi:hypothetical protein